MNPLRRLLAWLRRGPRLEPVPWPSCSSCERPIYSHYGHSLCESCLSEADTEVYPVEEISA